VISTLSLTHLVILSLFLFLFLSFSLSLSLFPGRYPNKMIKEPTTADIAFEIPTGEVYTVVEIVGMILGHAKFLAESPERLAVTGAVITVPPYFAQQERQALLDAAHVAGLRPAWLVNSDTAGAHFFPTKTKRIRPLTHSLTHSLTFFLSFFESRPSFWNDQEVLRQATPHFLRYGRRRHHC